MNYILQKENRGTESDEEDPSAVRYRQEDIDELQRSIEDSERIRNKVIARRQTLRRRDARIPGESSAQPA